MAPTRLLSAYGQKGTSAMLLSPNCAGGGRKILGRAPRLDPATQGTSNPLGPSVRFLASQPAMSPICRKPMRAQKLPPEVPGNYTDSPSFCVCFFVCLLAWLLACLFVCLFVCFFPTSKPGCAESPKLFQVAEHEQSEQALRRRVPSLVQSSRRQLAQVSGWMKEKTHGQEGVRLSVVCVCVCVCVSTSGRGTPKLYGVPFGKVPMHMSHNYNLLSFRLVGNPNRKWVRPFFIRLLCAVGYCPLTPQF